MDATDATCSGAGATRDTLICGRVPRKTGPHDGAPMQSEQMTAWFHGAYTAALGSLERGEFGRAEEQLRAIQQAMPGEVNSLRVLGLALLAQGRSREATEMLEAAVAAAPDFAHALADLGRALRAQGHLEPAIAALRKAVALDRTLPGAWFALGDLLVNTGDMTGAKDAFLAGIGTGPYAGALEKASRLMNDGDRPQAEAIFRDVLRQDPDQVGALCGLAAVSRAAGFPQDSLRLLRHALKQSAHLPLIHRGLAQTWLELAHFTEAEAAIRRAVLVDDSAAAGWVVLGSVLAHTLQQRAALAAYEQALIRDPRQIHVLLSKGHVLKTLGRRAECEAVYHECLRRQPDFVQAYYSLADLKNYRFSDQELAAMRALESAAPAGEAYAQLQFALGRADEQRGQYPQAFAHYAAGNAARRRDAPFDAAGFEHKSRRVAATFDAAFFAARGGAGCEDPAPIFIVGLPRSGSTLVEQLLASHSAIEGTMELPNIVGYVRELDQLSGAKDAYPECVANLPAERFRAMGERYIAETRLFRTGRPHFVDKMPNNFSHVGLIHLILPRAKIIDVRRHPLDACFSAFKQYFAKGQSFSYDLEDLGRYYRSYLALMDHWDTVLPGKVLHLSYEQLVRDTENQVRALLNYCGLPYEADCLRFYENERAVRTASSEQVRRPIYDSSIGYWRRFEADLAPLRLSLGGSLGRFDDLR